MGPRAVRPISLAEEPKRMPLLLLTKRGADSTQTENLVSEYVSGIGFHQGLKGSRPRSLTCLLTQPKMNAKWLQPIPSSAKPSRTTASSKS
jgi:hypothetical protein